MRVEQVNHLKLALSKLSATDREVLILRHLEQLSNGEVASVLDIDKSAATKRYVRALGRLGDLMHGS